MTQTEALDILKMGHSVFLTGSAGSGKTHLLNQYIDYLKKGGVEIGITASTGIAATHMGGVTIHSWAGIGIRASLTESDLEMLEERKYLWNRFQNTHVLIIDEISMLHHFRLDLIERVARFFKRNEAPFGGMQVIFCGDFFQLPPVVRQGEPEAHFVYDSDAWQALDLKICYLHEQFRHKDDAALRVLNDIRSNNVSEETLEALRGRYRKKPASAIAPTRLYTHNADVDMVNVGELNKISGDTKEFHMTHKGRDILVELLKKSCLAPATLTLKKDARVMFVKNNFEEGFVNGTLGVIVGFEDGFPVVQTTAGKKITAKPMNWSIEEEGKIKAEISQLPLRLAWAITVHKSQGMSLDAVEVDLSKSFEKGMGYVALSRVRTLDGLTLLGLNDMALQVHEEVLERDAAFKKQSEDAEGELAALKAPEVTARQTAFLSKVSGKKEKKPKKISTFEQTRLLLPGRLSIKEMAKKRGFTEGTIISHLETLVEEGTITADSDLKHLRPDPKKFKKISTAFTTFSSKNDGAMPLSPVATLLSNIYSYDDLRLVRLFLQST
ncbi:MAG TPA: AAA family ATPase [Candidatus Paceibacterota bacterium]